MNKAYRSIYNERTGTFVAVSENVSTRGKRASSRVSKVAVAIAGLATAGLMAGGALAAVVVDETGNKIDFTTSGGSINFTDTGSITGLNDLTVGGSLTADQIKSNGNAEVDGKLDVTGNTTIGGTLGVTGKSTLGELSAGATTLTGATQVNNTLNVTGNTTLNGLSAGTTNLGATTANSLVVTNNATVGGTLGVTGATTLDGATQVNNTLSVTGGTTLSGLTAGATTLGATTADSLNVTNNATVGNTLNVASGATKIDSTGISTNKLTVGGAGGPVITGTGIAMSGGTITGLADGIDDSDAVNKSQLDGVAATANKGWNLKAGTEATGQNVAPDADVTFVAGKNLEVNRTDAAIIYETSDEVEFDKVKVGDTVINKTAGIETNQVKVGTSGPLITSSGINMGGQKITNMANGDINATSTDAVTGQQVHDLFFESGTAEGIRYFHAKSADIDSVAAGQESIAIGPKTVSGGERSLAAGVGAVTTADAKDAIALGKDAQAGTDGSNDGEAAIAIGRNSQASGTSTIAMGDGAEVEHYKSAYSLAIGSGATVESPGIDGVSGATAIGHNALSKADGATAVGQNAQAIGGNAAAFGWGAQAIGGNTIALGSAQASGSNAIAAGTGAEALTADGIALGRGAGVNTTGDPGGDRHSHIAIGLGAGQNVNGNQTIAIGSGAGSDVGDNMVSSSGSIAIGTDAGKSTAGEFNIAIGHEANKNAGNVTHATAVGNQTKAKLDAVAVGSLADAAEKATALGADAKAEKNAVALGQGASAEQGHVALGFQSKAIADDAIGQGFLTGSSFDDGKVVSVGDTEAGTQRRIVNVADGSNTFDAVNVGQLQAAQGSVAALVGGVTLLPDGSYSKITVNTGSGTAEFDNVVQLVGAIQEGDVEILPFDAVTYDHYDSVAGRGTIAILDGEQAWEAVNLAQMNAAIAESSMEYYSVDPSSDAVNRDNTGASGANTMAAGPGASASGVSSLAMGHTAQVQSSDRAIAIGFDSRAQADKSTVVGNESRTHNVAGVAIGSNAVSHGINSIAMGTGALTEEKNTESTVNDAIAMGTDARSTADSATAIGHHSRAAGVKSLAQGFTAYALAESAIAQGSNSLANAENAQASGTRAQATAINAQARGTDAEASAQSAQASGTNATASGSNSIATGTRAHAWASNGIAMGTDSVSGFEITDSSEDAFNKNTIAIGNGAQATYLDATAIGRSAEADATKAAAFGDDAEARAEKALAAGASARATGEESSAFGAGAEATAEKALASGAGAKAQAASAAAYGEGADASAASALAAGAGAKASENNAVALGAGANAKNARSVALGDGAETAAPEGTSSMTVDKNTYSFAGDSPIGTVSVGTATEKRTITNVAAGRVSEDSTDAINGSQLFGTNQALDALAADLDTAGGSVATALGGGSHYNPDTHTVIADLTVNGNNYNNVQDALGYVGQGWKLTTNDSNSKLTPVLPGDTVDFEQGKNIVVDNVGQKVTIATADVVAFDTVTVGDTIIDQDDGITTNKVVIKHTGGDIDVGETLSKGITFDADGGTPTERKLGDTLKVAGDDNITTTASAGEIKVALNKDLVGLDSVETKEINVGDGVLVVKPGGTGDNNTFTIHGNTDIDIGGNQITNVAAGTEDDHAVNLGQLKEVSDIANTGWQVSVNQNLGNNEDQVAPGDRIDFQNADNNIEISKTANADDDGYDINFDLAKNLKLGDSSEDGSVTVTGKDGNEVKIDGATGTIGMTGADTSGTMTTIGVMPGDSSLAGSSITRIYYNDGKPGEDPVQVATMLDGLSFAGDAGTPVDRMLNQTLNIKGGATGNLTDGNIGVVADGNDLLEIKLAENIDLGSGGSVKMGDATHNTEATKYGMIVTGTSGITNVGAGQITVAGATPGAIPIIIDGGLGTIGGLTNKTFDPEDFTSGQAATEDQLKQVSDVANAGWFISANAEGKQTDNNVGPEGVADFSNTDGNIEIDRTDTNLTFDLASQLTLGSEDPDGEDGSVTVTGKDGNKVEIDGATGTIGMTGADTSGTMTTIGVMPGDSSLAGSSITRIYYNDGKPGEDPVQVATMLDGLSFAGDAGTPVDRMLNQTLNIKGGATGNLTDGNIGVVADGNDLLEIKLAENIDLGEDGSLKIGDSRLNNDGLRVKDADGNVTRVAAIGTTVKDDEGNRTVTRAKGVTVTDDEGNRTAVRSTGMTVTADDGSRTRVRAGDIRVAGKSGEEIRLNGDKGVITGLTNKTFDPDSFTSGQAATEDQLKQVSDVANAGWFISANGEGEQTDNNVGPEGVADFSNTDGNIVIDRTGTNLTFDLAKDVKLDDDGSLTVGQTVVDNEGVKVGEHVTLHDEGLKVTDDDGNETNTTAKGVETKDDDGNVTTLAATGTTVEDKDGNKTETTAKGVTVTDGDSTSSLVAGSLKLEDTVSGNTVILDAGTGHLTGLTNTVWDPDTIPVVIDRAATEGQLKQVHDIASAGWNATDEYGKEVNIGPDGTMNFASGNGNIKVDLHGVDDDGEVRVTLNKDIDLGDDGSLTIGQTKVDDDGVKVGDDVALHEGGLTVDDGAGNSTETTAGGTTVTGDDGSTTTVGAGTITVAGGGLGAPEVTIDGNKGTIGGLTNKTFTPGDIVSGQAATEDQLQALHDMPLTFGGDFGMDVDRKLGERLAVVGGATNEAHLTSGNIGVVANGRDQLEVKLNKDIDLGPDGSVQIGRTRVSDEGVRVGKDVHLGDRGLVINGGPSVTVDGIYAGGKRITGVAPGVLDDDAVNLGQLKGGLTNLDRQLTAKGLNFADQRGQSTHRNLGQTMQFVGADQNISTRVAGPGLMEIALNPNLVLESVVAEEVIAGDVIAEQVTTNRVVAGEVVAGEVAADRVVAGEVQADQVQADSILAIDLSTENIYTDNVTINNGGPVINEGGIDMSGQRIVNVAPGVNSGDAVNMGQLQAVHNNLQGQIQDVRQDLRRTDRRLRAGVAAAMATASLPQAYLPGKSMMSVAGGTWNGESGMAVGYSGISDNGNWVFKVSGNASSRGDYGGAVGVGYQW